MNTRRVYITRSKSGHYTVTVKERQGDGRVLTVFKQQYIYNLAQAREIAEAAV